MKIKSLLFFFITLLFSPLANSSYQFSFDIQNQTRDATLIYKKSGGNDAVKVIAYDVLIPVGKGGKYVLEGEDGEGKFFRVIYAVRHLTDLKKNAECVMDFDVFRGKIFLKSAYDRPADPNKPPGNTFIQCEKSGDKSIIVRDK